MWQAQLKDSKKRMREIRGSGEQHAEEQPEEENEFEEDEEISVESDGETLAVKAKTDESSHQKDKEGDQKNETRSINKSMSNDSLDEAKVLKRLRG